MLFNLYSFDKLRTTSSKPPELNIIDCTFKFFVNKLDALIQVETNNLGYYGDNTASDDEDSRILTYYGEDRGALITIQNTGFFSNSFCKGLIYYNNFQKISYEDAP